MDTGPISFLVSNYRQLATLPSHLELKPNFTIITDDKDRMTVLRDAIAGLEQRGYDVSEPENLLKQIDVIFTHAISVNELGQYFEEVRSDEVNRLVAAFYSYLEVLKRDNQLDFPSMLYFARELLTTKHRIARQVRTVWSEPLRVDNELSNFNSWREIYEKDEAALRPCIQDIGNSRT